MTDVMEEQRLRFNKDRQEQLDNSRPYVPGRFVPGGFSVGARDTYHFDVYARRRPGYVQWYYEKNPDNICYPMSDNERERAFRIRGAPGDIKVADERWDRPEMKEPEPGDGWRHFPSVEAAMTWIVKILLMETET